MYQITNNFPHTWEAWWGGEGCQGDQWWWGESRAWWQWQGARCGHETTDEDEAETDPPSHYCQDSPATVEIEIIWWKNILMFIYLHQRRNESWRHSDIWRVIKSIIIFIMIVIVVLRIEISVSSITTTKQLLYEQSSEIQWLSVSNQPTSMILKIHLNVLLTCIWSWCVGRLFFSENYETIWCCTTAR